LDDHQHRARRPQQEEHRGNDIEQPLHSIASFGTAVAACPNTGRESALFRSLPPRVNMPPGPVDNLTYE
ncbi:MAG: hypothetical protein ACYTEI_05335, partial [Planctomycetota bacterium]